MNLVANTLERWLDRNSAEWLHHIMLAVNCIVVASVVLREVRRSTSSRTGVERTDINLTGSGEKECRVDGGEE